MWTAVLAAAALFAVLGAGCRANLTEYVIPEYKLASAAPALTDEQMGEAVRLGCEAAGWSVVKEDPGVTYAQVTAGRDEATVAIPYNGSSFKIEHHESTPGVAFNGEVVHHRYKFWVERLYRYIRDEVDRVGGAGPGAAAAPAAPAAEPAAEEEGDLPPIEPAE